MYHVSNVKRKQSLKDKKKMFNILVHNVFFTHLVINVIRLIFSYLLKSAIINIQNNVCKFKILMEIFSMHMYTIYSKDLVVYI